MATANNNKPMCFSDMNTWNIFQFLFHEDYEEFECERESEVEAVVKVQVENSNAFIYEKNCGGKEAIEPAKQVAIFVWFLATNWKNFDIAHKFNHTVSSIYRCIRRVAGATYLRIT